VAASEDLPHLKNLAAAIRAAKADIGNAFHTGPGLDIRDRPSGVFASLKIFGFSSRFIPQSNANQGTTRAVCAGPKYLSLHFSLFYRKAISSQYHTS
jgi:hypothetical protein